MRLLPLKHRLAWITEERDRRRIEQRQREIEADAESVVTYTSGHKMSDEQQERWYKRLKRYGPHIARFVRVDLLGRDE